MAQALFVFLQMEFPWVLGPPDGRYLLRDPDDGEPVRVIALDTLAAGRVDAARRHETGSAGWLSRRSPGARRERPADAQAAPVSTSRVTVIDPVSLSAESQARAWLADLDREREVTTAVGHVNVLLQAHRIASADPYVHELAAAQALITRAGWGEGEQVAHGQWLHAVELAPLPRRRGRRRDRSWALRPQERLAALLAGRNAALMCEELALRTRADLDAGRLGHAAIGLDRALTAAVVELRGEGREDLALRIAELESLHEGVAEQARVALAVQPESAPDQEALEHALGRLEAALRARTATGV
jgi:hypothetical protein